MVGRCVRCGLVGRSVKCGLVGRSVKCGWVGRFVKCGWVSRSVECECLGMSWKYWCELECSEWVGVYIVLCYLSRDISQVTTLYLCATTVVRR